MKTKIAMLAGLFILCAAWCAIAETEVFPEMGQNIKQTVVVATTNSSVVLTTAVDAAIVAAGGTALNWQMVRSVLITCETYDARIAFGVAASNTVGHVLATGNSLRIPSNSLIRAARIISKTQGSAATLQITPEM